MNTIYNYNDNDIPTFVEFCEFITEVNQDFVPPLLDRLDIEQFYSKIKLLANIITCRVNNKLVGLCVFYCNDTNTFQSYLTLIAISAQHRGKGIASQLCLRMEKSAATCGMTHLSMHTNNPIALHMYQHLGYSIINKSVIAKGITRYHLTRHI